MSLTCPVDLDMLMLRREISAMYARVATAPEGEFHFHGLVESPVLCRPQSSSRRFKRRA